MTFIDILQEAADIPEASYIKLLHQYKFNEKTMHLFFEGLDDQSFYMNYIENLFPKDYTFHYYICNGKTNVYTNYKDINWNIYNKNRILFFTDKDLDDIIGISNIKDENIFETLYYSIENYIVTEDVYCRFLRELCFITDDHIINQLKAQFQSQLSLFNKKLNGISAWIIYCRKNNLNVNLNDFDISKIFSISDDFKIIKNTPKGFKTPFQYICSATKTNHYNLLEIKKILIELKKIYPQKRFIRGKFELCFFYLFCKKTIDIIIPLINSEIKIYNRTNKVKKTKAKATVQIKPENILHVTAPRVRLPNDIDIFLNNNLQKLNSIRYQRD